MSAKEGKLKSLHKSDKMYELLQAPDGKLLLDVVVGTIALYTARLQLDEGERKKYQERGTAFLDELAADVVKNEPRYREQGRTRPVD